MIQNILSNLEETTSSSGTDTFYQNLGEWIKANGGNAAKFIIPFLVTIGSIIAVFVFGRQIYKNHQIISSAESTPEQVKAAQKKKTSALIGLGVSIIFALSSGVLIGIFLGAVNFS